MRQSKTVATLSTCKDCQYNVENCCFKETIAKRYKAVITNGNSLNQFLYINDFLGFKNQEIYEMSFQVDHPTLKFVPDHYRTKEMYEKAAEEELWSLIFVSDKYKI